MAAKNTVMRDLRSITPAY